MTRALVTGGGGFVGSHLVDQLVTQGIDVVVFDDFSTGRLENLQNAQATGRLDVVVGSVLHDQELRAAMSGCDHVFHLATKSVRHSLGHPTENHDVNSRGTLNALEAARRLEVERFVYCSSSEVYGNVSDVCLQEELSVCDPVTIYGATKLAGEHYAKAYFKTYGLPTVIVRPFNAYGPRAHVLGESGEVIPRFIARAANGLPPVIFGSGRQTRDFTFVSDIARGIALAGQKNEAIGRTINLALGSAVCVMDLATLVLDLCGRLDIKPLHHPARPGDVNALAADTLIAQGVLGFHPEIGLKEGLHLYLQWLKDEVPDLSSLLEKHLINWTIPA